MCFRKYRIIPPKTTTDTLPNKANIKQLLDDEHVMVGDKKYSCPLKYMKREIQNNIPGFVDEQHI